MGLVVELDLDTGTFTKKLKEAEGTAETSAGRIGSAFMSAAKGMGAVVAAGTTMAAGLGANAVVLAEQLQKMSIRTGASVEWLSKLKFAADQSGTSIEGIEAGLHKFNRAIVAAKEGGPGAEQVASSLGRLGIEAEELQQLSPDQLFLRIADAVRDMGDAAETSASLQEIFGRGGTQLIPMLKRGGEGLLELQQTAEELNLGISQSFANQSAQMIDDLNELKSVFTGIGIQLAQEFLPDLLKVTAEFKEWAKTSGDIKAGFDAVLLVVTKIKDGIAFISQGAGAVSVAAEQMMEGNTGGAAAALGGGSGTKFALDAAAGSARGALRNLPGGEVLSALGVPGFARGTDSAPAGLAVVGEEGPELVKFGGGEQVIPNGAGMAGGGKQESLSERVRRFFAVHTASGIQTGMTKGGEDGMGRGKTGSGLASTIFQGAFAANSAGLIDSFLSGDVKGGMKGFAKGLGKSVGDEVKKHLIATLGKKLLGSVFGGGSGLIAGFAGGTDYAPGGLALVGEEGPELVNLPRGSQVTTASETRQAMSGPTFDLRGSSFSFGGSAQRVNESMALEFAEMLERLVKRNRVPGLVAALA